MSDIYEILNINIKSLTNFHFQANLVNNEQNIRVVEKTCNALKRIEEIHLLSEYQIPVTSQALELLLSKVKKMSITEEFTSRDLRILAYNLNMLKEESDVFRFALNLLEKNWRDLFFNALVRFVLENWHGINKENLIEVRKKLLNKLKQYSGFNKKYLLFKEHYNLLEEYGPIRMLTLLKAKNIDLYKAPTILSQIESSFHLSYYDDVIIEYFKECNEINLPYMEEVLTKHNSNRTNKLVLANLILKADGLFGESQKVDIGNAARKILGDITSSSTWAPFIGASEEEITKLKNAFIIINQWCTNQVIQTFFEVCVQDPERRAFWSRCVKEIYDFRIVGSWTIKNYLKADKRISSHLGSKFIETCSRTTKTAALIMFIRDRVFVEFSDVGSLYVYMPDHEAIAGILDKQFIGGINLLKDRSIGTLVRGSYYYATYSDYGYLMHYRTWQDKLSDWMISKLKLNIPASTFITQKDFSTQYKPERSDSLYTSNSPSLLDNPSCEDLDTTLSGYDIEEQQPETENNHLNPESQSDSTDSNSNTKSSKSLFGSLPILNSISKLFHGKESKEISKDTKEKTIEQEIPEKSQEKLFTETKTEIDPNLTLHSDKNSKTTSSIKNTKNPFLRENVNIFDWSTDIFEENFCVVINEDGLYLFQRDKNKFYILLEHDFDLGLNPKVSIKNPNKYGYWEIIIETNDNKTLRMGYVKKVNSCVVLYMNQKSVIRRITLD